MALSPALGAGFRSFNSRVTGEPYLLWRAVDKHGAELDIQAQTLRLAPRVGVERAFGRFADKAVVIQMHADRERIVADFMECLPRL